MSTAMHSDSTVQMISPKASESLRKINLRTAVFEYLDDKDVFDFIKDLKHILEEEENTRRAEADIAKEVKDFLFGSTILSGDS